MNQTTLPKVMPIHEDFEGSIPVGYDLVVYEQGQSTEDALVLYGFDEIGLFEEEFKNPAYAFLSQEDV